MTAHIHDCIRCDYCSDVCPEQLQPQQLYTFSRFLQHEQALQFDLLQCTECGACESVCPSRLPLLAYFREEKLALHDLEQSDAEAAHWQTRFERHQARGQRDAIAQQERKLQKLQAKTEALAAGESISRQVSDTRVDDNADATPVAAKTPAQIQADIAAAVARTRARKAALQQESSNQKSAAADNNNSQDASSPDATSRKTDS